MKKTIIVGLALGVLSETTSLGDTLYLKGNEVKEKKECFPVMKIGDYYGLLIFKKEGNKLVPVFNKYKSVRFKGIDVSKLKSELPQNLVINKKGKKSYFVFLDLMCPYCTKNGIREFKKLVFEGNKVYVVPFPVHGEPSVKAWSCVLSLVDKGKNLFGMVSKYLFIYKNSKNLKEYEKKIDKVCPKDWKNYEGEVIKLARYGESTICSFYFTSHF